MLKLKLADFSNDDFQVYLVDGEYIRDETYIDFTEGGSWLRYPDFIPEREIWLGGIHIIEGPYVLIHEMTEVVYALEHGFDISTNAKTEDDYSEAHDHANEREQAARDAPNTVDEMLAELIEELRDVLNPPEGKTLWKQLEKS